MHMCIAIITKSTIIKCWCNSQYIVEVKHSRVILEIVTLYSVITTHQKISVPSHHHVQLQPLAATWQWWARVHATHQGTLRR